MSDQRDSIVRAVHPPSGVLFQKGGSDLLSLVSWIDANGVNADRLPFWIVDRHGLVGKAFGFGQGGTYEADQPIFIVVALTVCAQEKTRCDGLAIGKCIVRTSFICWVR